MLPRPRGSPRTRRSLGGDGQGVSAVVATILLVAVAIVLATGAYIAAQELKGQQPKSAPKINFAKDDAVDRIYVTSAQSGADWSRIAVRLTGCTQATGSAILRLGAAVPYHNDAPSAGGAALNAAGSGATCGAGLTVNVASTSAIVHAQDFLALCGSPAGAGLTSVELTVVDVQANLVLWNVAFLTVADCA